MPEKIIMLKDFYNIRLVHVKETRLPSSAERIPHSHDHCEMFVHIAGNMDIFAEKTTYHLYGGEIRIYSSGELHCGNIGQKQHVEWYQVDFPPEFLEFEGSKDLMKMFFDREFGTGNVFVPEDQEEICRLLSEIFACIDNDPLTVHFQRSALIQVLCRACRAYCDAQKACQSMQYEINRDNFSIENLHSEQKKDALNQMIDMINEHYMQINSVEELCRIAHYSPSYVNRIFREGINISPYQFLIGKKLNEAKKVLRAGMSVADACEYAGFSDYSNFITLFKRKFGVTPKQYGKQFEKL